jgi:hypothetical protein
MVHVWREFGLARRFAVLQNLPFQMNEPKSIEEEWLTSAAVADIVVIKTAAEPAPSGDDWNVVIDGRIGAEDEDDVEWAAFGVIYALSMLSFHDARPRGMSEKEFLEDDEWLAADMLRCLQFQRGELHLHADYVRGRMMKTFVTVRRDGTFQLETANRGQAATRWIAMLQGKKGLTIAGE